MAPNMRKQTSCLVNQLDSPLPSIWSLTIDRTHHYPASGPKQRGCKEVFHRLDTFSQHWSDSTKYLVALRQHFHARNSGIGVFGHALVLASTRSCLLALIGILIGLAGTDQTCPITASSHWLFIARTTITLSSEIRFQWPWTFLETLCRGRASSHEGKVVFWCSFTFLSHQARSVTHSQCLDAPWITCPLALWASPWSKTHTRELRARRNKAHSNSNEKKSERVVKWQTNVPITRHPHKIRHVHFRKITPKMLVDYIGKTPMHRKPRTRDERW
jgi:hypothetical protein